MRCPSPNVQAISKSAAGTPIQRFVQSPRVLCLVLAACLGLRAIPAAGQPAKAKPAESKPEPAAGKAPAAAPRPTGGAPLASFLAHSPAATFVLFSNDGQKLISGGSDRLVQVWEMKTGKLLRTLAGHDYGVTCGALSPEGTRLVTGSWDRTIRVWDIDSFEPKGNLKGHTGTVEAVALSPDGKTIASGGADRVFRLWDVAMQKSTFCSVEQELPVRRIAFSPDGKLLATGTGNANEWRLPGAVKLWNAESGEEHAEFSGHSACVGVVVFSPDGKRLATGTANGELRICDVAKRTETSKTNLGTGVRTVAFLGDDRTLAIGQWPSRVFLWDMPTQKRVTMYAGHEQPDAMVDKVALSPDGSLIASTGTDGIIYFWAVPQSAMRGGPPLWTMPKDGKPPAAELVRRWEPR